MIVINGKKYEVVEESRGSLDIAVLTEKLTEYFDNYDYIVGDWAYGKLRLKGFNDSTNKNFNKINDYHNIKKYIEDYCAYGCKYFILKRNYVD